MTGDRIHVVQGDITTFEGDAIVNAANPDLAPGGGVCGAIFRAAGREALEAEIRTRYPQGCPTGEAVITGGHGLPARHIVHAVGPIWYGGERGEAELLASAYRRSLDVAREAGCETVAFPAISTGIYGFPAEPAAEIAVRTVADFLGSAPRMSVTLYAFDRGTFELLSRVVAKDAG